MLCNGGDAGRQTASERNEDVFDWRRTVIFRSEDLGMIRIKAETRPMLLFLAETIERFDYRMAMGPVLPRRSCAPLKLCRIGRISQRCTRVDQCLNVDTVVHLRFGNRHRLSPSFFA